MSSNLRVLSYNIHKGFSANNRKLVLNQIRESIRKVDADVVFLQEVVGYHDENARKHKDWPTLSQFEYLADTSWPHFAYGKNAVYTAGHHGNALLSKYPIVEWRNQDVSTNLLESRGILHAVTSKFSLHCICVHFGLFEAGRRSQLNQLNRFIHKNVPASAPLIVAGDFNDWQENASKKLLSENHLVEVFKTLQGQYARTFPSWLPVLPLDRIYCRGFKVLDAVCLSRSPWNKLSDHVALYAELKI